MGAVTMETNEESLVFEDSNQREGLLRKLNVLRKNRQFCDVTFVVGEHETPAHRAVLACVSPFLFETFSCAGDDKCNPQVKLKSVDHASFEHLLNYAYTSKLEVPADDVTGVYRAAVKLRIAEVTEVCSRFLALHLTPANCLDTWRFAENGLKQKVYEYIRNNFDTVVTGNVFSGLPRLNVDIIGADEDLLSISSDDQLARLVLDWAKSNISQKTLDKLSDNDVRKYMLYLNADSVLTDCSQLTEMDGLNQAQIVQDYKKFTRKASGNGSKTSGPNPRSPNVKRFSILGEVQIREREWSVIATSHTADQLYTALVVLDNKMMTVMIRFVNDLTSQEPEKPESPKAEKQSQLISKRKFFEGRQASLVPLEKMSCARCTMGVLVVQGKLVVCGGYDRGECMDTVESYDMDTNHWTSLPNMLTQRGRFDVAELQGKLYACGGSNGSVELGSVECFDFQKQKWSYVASLRDVRSNCGVASLNGKLYCVGGISGVTPVNSCEVYDPVENKWRKVASLNYRRSQASVCAFNGHLVAAGGSDSWNCHNSVEIYDPESDTWELISPLNTARRGAGVAVLNGKLFVVGGNDGSHSLASVEMYQPDNDCWMMGAPLTTPRANVGLAVLGRNLLAVGGFSGKNFLDTIEYLNEDEESEWCMFVPVQSRVIAQKVREKRQSGDLEEKVSANGTNGVESQGETLHNGTNGIHENGSVYTNGTNGVQVNGLLHNGLTTVGQKGN